MINKSIRIKAIDILSDHWYTLKKVVYEFKNKDGHWETHTRESYDRGNGAAILLYNRDKHSVILTRQFRMPTYLNGNTDGMMIEVCAGVLDEQNPEACIRKEAEEETGYRLEKVSRVFDSYMSPGAVTEILSFFIAEYDDSMRIGKGGGVQEEEEHIEVLELDFEDALKMIANGEIRDAKTIMLLQYAKINDLLT